MRSSLKKAAGVVVVDASAEEVGRAEEVARAVAVARAEEVARAVAGQARPPLARGGVAAASLGASAAVVVKVEAPPPPLARGVVVAASLGASEVERVAEAAAIVARD